MLVATTRKPSDDPGRALFRRARNGDLVGQRHCLHTSGSKPKDRSRSSGLHAFPLIPHREFAVVEGRQSRNGKAGLRLVPQEPKRKAAGAHFRARLQQHLCRRRLSFRPDRSRRRNRRSAYSLRLAITGQGLRLSLRQGERQLLAPGPGGLDPPGVHESRRRRRHHSRSFDGDLACRGGVARCRHAQKLDPGQGQECRLGVSGYRHRRVSPSICRDGPKSPHFTIFTSTRDKALEVSRWLSGGVDRVGGSDLRPYAAILDKLGVSVIDTSSIASNDPLGHNSFADSPEIVRLLGRRLAGQSLSGREPTFAHRVAAAAAGFAGSAARVAVVRDVLKRESSPANGEIVDGQISY